MHVLLTGSTGFIGSRVLNGLLRDGHRVTCAVRPGGRRPKAAVDLVPIGFSHATRPDDWSSALLGVDAIVNAVGILRETARQRFSALHTQAPCALFEAGSRAGVTRIVQISALGADEAARSAYHLSKRMADDCLAALPVSGVIVQPSLVYGAGGTSAKLFSALAAMPLIPVPGEGRQDVQPVHVDDVVDGIGALLREPGLHVQGRIAFVGPEPMMLRDFYARLRRASGRSSTARFVPIPMAIMRTMARLGDRVPGVLLDTDTLGMLERGNTGEPAAFRQLLGREIRPVERFAA